MALIIEDGTGIEGANSYCSVAAADSYFTLSGAASWATLSNEKKEASLFQATQYMDLVWGSQFPGTKWKDTQGLLMPRKKCCHDEEPFWPVAIVTACCEYALRASAAPLAPDPEIDETGRQSTMKREKVGPLEEETRWGIPNGQMPIITFRPYPIADAMMRSFLPVRSTGRVIH